MSDYRTMFDSKYLGAWDLPAGKDVTVTIVSVAAETVRNAANKEARKPVLMFQGKNKGLLLNKTNAKTVAAMYGTDTTKWAQKRISLYATTTMMGPERVDCIRVRPSVPSAKTASAPPDAGPTPEEIAAIKAAEMAEAAREPGQEG